MGRGSRPKRKHPGRAYIMMAMRSQPMRTCTTRSIRVHVLTGTVKATNRTSRTRSRSSLTLTSGASVTKKQARTKRPPRRCKRSTRFRSSRRSPWTPGTACKPYGCLKRPLNYPNHSPLPNTKQSTAGYKRLSAPIPPRTYRVSFGYPVRTTSRWRAIQNRLLSSGTPARNTSSATLTSSSGFIRRHRHHPNRRRTRKRKWIGVASPARSKR